MTQSPSRGLTPNTITLGIEFQDTNLVGGWGGHKHLVYSRSVERDLRITHGVLAMWLVWKPLDG